MPSEPREMRGKAAVLGEATASWLSRERLRAGITRLWEPHVHRFFRANMWLVEGRDADLVVDFGMGLASLAATLDRDAGKPLLAVATQVHLDHVGSFHEFHERLGHEAEAADFASVRDEATFAHVFRAMPDAVDVLPHAGWTAGDFRLIPAPLSRVLREGSEVDLGDLRFEILHFPGHSPGSIGLWEPARRLLLSGDAIYAGTLIDDLPGSDVGQYLRTMERLLSLDADLVLPGHNEPLGGGAMHEIARQYIRTKDR